MLQEAVSSPRASAQAEMKAGRALKRPAETLIGLVREETLPRVFDASPRS